MSGNYFKKNKRIYTELLKFLETGFYIKDLEKGQNAYLSVLQRYTEFTGMNPEELIEEARNNIREAKDRLFQFGDFLKAKGVSNRTIRQYLGSKLGRFFKYNMHPIIWTKMDWNRYPDIPVKPKEIRENGVKIEEWISILKKILIRAKNLRDKAIICSLFSSAMDLVDFFKITKQKWDENYDKASNTNVITYKRSKTDTYGVAFFTSESCSYIKEYFRFERRKFESEVEPIFLTFRKNKKDIDHQRPLEPQTFRNLLSSITSELNIEGLTPKFIRNLTITYLKRAGFQELYINTWIGSSKELIRTYDLEYIEDLRKNYLKIEDVVTIGNGSNQTVLKVNALDKKVRELHNEIREIKSELKEINATLLILKTYMTRLT